MNMLSEFHMVYRKEPDRYHYFQHLRTQHFSLHQIQLICYPSTYILSLLWLVPLFTSMVWSSNGVTFTMLQQITFSKIRPDIVHALVNFFIEETLYKCIFIIIIIITVDTPCLENAYRDCPIVSRAVSCLEFFAIKFYVKSDGSVEAAYREKADVSTIYSMPGRSKLTICLDYWNNFTFFFHKSAIVVVVVVILGRHPQHPDEKLSLFQPDHEERLTSENQTHHLSRLLK